MRARYSSADVHYTPIYRLFTRQRVKNAPNASNPHTPSSPDPPPPTVPPRALTPPPLAVPFTPLITTTHDHTSVDYLGETTFGDLIAPESDSSTAFPSSPTSSSPISLSSSSTSTSTSTSDLLQTLGVRSPADIAALPLADLESRLEETMPTPRPPRIDPHRGVYCSRTLNMRNIQVIGYDMDYTLLEYDATMWEGRCYAYCVAWLATQGVNVEGKNLHLPWWLAHPHPHPCYDSP